MQYIKYPEKKNWSSLLARPTFDTTHLFDTVNHILLDVKQRGDKAIIEYEEKFDKVRLDVLPVSDKELVSAETKLSKELKDAILLAKNNIARFHAAQAYSDVNVETMPGVHCWQKNLPIEKVGLYIPGGSAPLFSTVLMLAIPAQIAGCKEIILCSPPNTNGDIHPAILYAAHISGVSKVYKIGGVQAIAAMAYGTTTVPKVYKIFGPGNQYVTAAKQLVSLKDVAIDMPAGPSEVEVIADETANPAFVAADLLSQAEHGADSSAILLTTNNDFAIAVQNEVEIQLPQLSRVEIALKALNNSKIILLHTMEDIIEWTNDYAPEHLIISTKNYTDIANRITNAGSIFLGHLTPESAGDYASGTNHTLPTNGYAKAYSGVNLDSFKKKITYQELTKEGLQAIGTAIEVMAENELLTAHKNAVTLRLQSLL
jgi:histidinol dehydrogenase